MTFSGDLTGLSLADVFQNVAGNRSTGWMTVEWRQHVCHVRFGDGAVTGFSLGAGERMVSPDFLVQRGYVTADAMQKLRQKHRRSRKSPCQLAIVAKLLDVEAAADAAMTRIEELVYDLMLIKEAAFQFTDGVPPGDLFDPDQDSERIRLDVGALLMEGARRRDEWTRIHRAVGTDRDFVILLEGWEDVELGEIAVQVAPLLDGRTDARAILRHVPASRFDVMKAMTDLVHAGVARLASVDELREVSAEAREAGDAESAIRLMQQALAVERGNSELRHELVDLLVAVGRPKDAAVELATMAHDAVGANEVTTAVALYERAYELNPDDLPLLERRVEVLRDHGDDATYIEGVRGVVTVYLEIGLADRARTLLRDAVSRKSLRTDECLTEALAKVEASLGHWEESSRLFKQLAEQVLGRDQARAVELLRSAHEQTPDDDTLGIRIRDIESGLANRRVASRRRIVALGSAAAVLITVGIAGVAEFQATRRVLDAFDGSLGILGDGNVVESLEDLDAVRRDLLWSPTRSRAGELFERLADLQLGRVETWIRDGEYERACEVLHAIVDRVDRPDLQKTCKLLLERVGLEEGAHRTLASVDHAERSDPAALQALEAMTEGRFLEFHLAHLATVHKPEVRVAMLRALSKIESPRVVPVVARLYLTETDPLVRTEMRVVFARQAETVADADAWTRLEHDLSRAADAAETEESARELLQLLFHQ